MTTRPPSPGCSPASTSVLAVLCPPPSYAVSHPSPLDVSSFTHLYIVSPDPPCNSSPTTSSLTSPPLAVLCTALGAIQLGSKTAFTDLVGSFIILTTVSYALAILPHVLTGRSHVPKGSFWMGRAGYFVNVVAVVLITFFNIMFCFRAYTPLRSAFLSIFFPWYPLFHHPNPR